MRMLKAALFASSLLQATKMAMASDVNKTLSGAGTRTRMLGLGKCKCAFMMVIDRYKQKAELDGLMQKRCNSSALAMELHLSCIKP